jgi:hypothetical protein
VSTPITAALIPATVSFAVAVGANWITIWLHRRAVNAQTYVTVINAARTAKFSQGMDIIRRLPYLDENGNPSHFPHGRLTVFGE